MPLSELTILLPCHSLEDFPLELAGESAQGMLAAWSALWHPSLLAAAGKVPRWYRADFPPDDLEGRIIAIPPVSEAALSAEWLERATAAEVTLVRHQTDRTA